jgi:serine-type D-Ala-D-Ala carboxypeptidase/endopeptidase
VSIKVLIIQLRLLITVDYDSAIDSHSVGHKQLMKTALIAGYALLFCVHCSWAAEVDIFTDGEVAGIQPFLDKYVGKSNSAMVIGLVDETGPKVFSAGKLDNGTDGTLNGDTVFLIGSVSKTFTTLAFLDMVERGEVKSNDPLAKYLPPSVNVPSYQDRQITLNDLATQSAGLPFNPDSMKGPDDRADYEQFTAEKMYTFLSGYALSRQPGTEFQYSNVGMALLGQAMMNKTGKDYESLIAERICGPLNMTSTRVALTPELRSRLAMGHEKDGKQVLPFKLDAYQPAGAILSTANDLLKYAAAQAGLTPSKLSASISQSHIIRHTDLHGRPGLDMPEYFGRTATCWFDQNAVQPTGMDLLAHGGGAGSYHAYLGFDQKQHRGMVVLTTANDVSVTAIGWTLLQRLPLTGESVKEFAREMVGIGTTLAVDENTHTLRIMKVLVNSPAAGAGLSAGLLIQKIDDVSTENKEIAQCMKLLRGPAGSKVRLDILDPQHSKTKSVELVRKKFATIRS